MRDCDSNKYDGLLITIWITCRGDTGFFQSSPVVFKIQGNFIGKQLISFHFAFIKVKTVFANQAIKIYLKAYLRGFDWLIVVLKSPTKDIASDQLPSLYALGSYFVSRIMAVSSLSSS